jgi:hypothetical protein
MDWGGRCADGDRHLERERFTLEVQGPPLPQYVIQHFVTKTQPPWLPSPQTPHSPLPTPHCALSIGMPLCVTCVIFHDESHCSPVACSCRATVSFCYS